VRVEVALLLLQQARGRARVADESNGESQCFFFFVLIFLFGIEPCPPSSFPAAAMVGTIPAGLPELLAELEDHTPTVSRGEGRGERGESASTHTHAGDPRRLFPLSLPLALPPSTLLSLSPRPSSI
jgi:hypothetical protein